jgi:hypothetical protein
MGSLISCSSRVVRTLLIALIALWSGFPTTAFAQGTAPKPEAASQPPESNLPFRRDNLRSNWSRRGRVVPGQSAAPLRFRAYRQKMNMRAQRALALGSRASPNAGSSAFWQPLGPAPLASDATGDGMQDYNWVSGRATSVVIDPGDGTANTVFLGGAYGGLWKSINAGSLSSSPASVTWQPLIDDQPTLAVGAIALQPGNSNLILIGTGETNSSGDSYYGLGILRSIDGGTNWTQVTSAVSGQSFQGVGFSKIAFGGASTPNVVVAATAGDNGLYLGEEEDGNSTARGLYFSTDAGTTWNRVILSDGAVPASATSVIYNPNQGAAGTFYAFIRRHGLYSSVDGQHFARLPNQPSAGLAAANCPAGTNATTCLVYRGEFAVVPGRNEMYTWVVDVQPDINGNPSPVDEGLRQSLNGGASWTPIPDNGITNCGDSAFGQGNSGCGVEQGYYNLSLAAIPNGAATDVYAGAINIYKCTLAGGTVCTQGDWINLTHVYGCNPGPLGEPAHVHPDQHGISFAVAAGKSPGYFVHDGGISRTLDGYTELNSGSCTSANQFDSLSETLGSMTEFVSASVHPTNPNIILGGTQDNGAPKTSTATSSTTWQNSLGGDGGFNAINPNNPSEWFASNPYLTILKCETGPVCKDASFSEVVSPSTLGGDEGAFYTPFILDPQNLSELLVGTCRVWRVSTSGTAPLQLSNDFDTLGTGVCTGGEINLVTALAAGGPTYSQSNSSVVYAATDGYGPLSGLPGGEVWVTTNAGVALMTNVTQNINPQGYAIAAVALDSSDISGDTAYAGIMGFSAQSYPTSHVWKTVRAGAAWADWTGSGSTALPDAPVNALIVDPQAGKIYAGTDVGAFVTTTSAPSWTEVGPSPAPGAAGFLPNAPVSALKIFNDAHGTKTLVASTYGRGVWSFPLSPNFTNAISNSPQTIFPTQTAVFNGTLSSEIGYSNQINLSCSGAAPSTCTTTANVIPTAPYNVTAGGVVGDYTFSAHAVGTDTYSIAHDAPITLHIVDFNSTVPSPNSLSVGQGETSQPITFTVSASGSFEGTVALSCSSGLPSGATCLFSPSNSVTPTASAPVTVTLVVSAAPTTPIGGPTAITVAASSAGAPAAKTKTFALTVKVATPDFTISVTPTPSSTAVNQSVIWAGSLTAIDGYNARVALSCTTGAPANCAISPSSVTPTPSGAAFTVTLASSAPGIFTFTIQGSDGTLTHATPAETLTVTAVSGSFSWTNTGSPSISLLAGQSASYKFSASPVAATFATSVNFVCSGLPALTSCAFSPASIAAGAPTTPVTLTVTTTGPNFGMQSRPRYLSSENSAVARSKSPSTPPAFSGLLGLFTLSWAIAFGVSGTGWRRRKKSPFLLFVASVSLALGLIAQISCGGLASTSTTTPPVTVTVNPGLATLFENEPGNLWPAGVCQQQFTATVNASSNQTVTWTVTGGGAIDGNGLYTSPANVPNQASATVMATSTIAASPGSAFVTIAPASSLSTSQITVTATAVGGTVHSDAVTLIVQ